MCSKPLHCPKGIKLDWVIWINGDLDAFSKEAAQAEQKSVGVRITWVQIMYWLIIYEIFFFNLYVFTILCVCVGGVYFDYDHLKDEEIRVQRTVIIIITSIITAIL